MRKSYASIDEYISEFPAPVQEILQQVRRTIHQAAPQAQEAISYQMPTFKFHGNLVHFAAYAHHVGFYPASSGIGHFTKDLEGYKTSPGAVQFPLDRPIPYELIARITRFRLAENLERAEAKKKKK